MRHALLFCLSLLGVPAASAACFTVFDRLDRVVYQAIEPPIDMSYPIAEEMARAYPPGHHLLVSPNAYCPGFDEPANVYAVPLPGSRILGSGSPALALADIGRRSFRGAEPAGRGNDWVAPTVAEMGQAPPAGAVTGRRADGPPRRTPRRAP